MLPEGSSPVLARVINADDVLEMLKGFVEGSVEAVNPPESSCCVSVQGVYLMRSLGAADTYLPEREW